MVEEFKLLDSKVINFSFESIKEPSTAKGFYSYSISPEGGIKNTESESHIEIINKAKVVGYLGVPPEDEETLSDDDKVFELLIVFKFVYLISKEDQKEDLLVENSWFFDGQSKIYSKQVIQSFLSNTAYHNIIIGL